MNLFERPKRGKGRPPKSSTLLRMLWENYPSVKSMREHERKKAKRVV
jgi:hypothetical protein